MQATSTAGGHDCLPGDGRASERERFLFCEKTRKTFSRWGKAVDFSVNTRICGRTISIHHLKQLTEEGKTEMIEGFTSKNGNPFSAALKLENGRAVFDFPPKSASPGAGRIWSEEAPPPPDDPPPEYG